MISSILFPGPFEPDFRIPIFIAISMIVYIRSYIKKNWNDIQDEFSSDWE
jgi:hypothetical protein